MDGAGVQTVIKKCALLSLVIFMAAAGAIMAFQRAYFGPPDRTILPAHAEIEHLLDSVEGVGLEHHVRLAPVGEPGQTLWVIGRLIRSEDGQPIADKAIEVYQADDTGSYDEQIAGDESSARLSGVVVTDAQGRFIVQTVLPGDYGSTSDNRHMHTKIEGAAPDAYDLFFKQYMNAGLARWAKRSSQAMVIDLQQRQDGTLVGSVDLVVKGYSSSDEP